MSDRQKLFDELIMINNFNNSNDGIDDLKNSLYIALDKYEIEERTTELAVIHEDRNEFLFKKFIIAKTVKGLTDRTIKYYREMLGFIFERINKTVDEVEADDVRLYIAIRQKRDNISKVTADNELRVLRTFYNYLYTEELIKRNPMLKIDAIKTSRGKKSAFTEVEIEKLRSATQNNRERAILELLLSTGCRVSELTSIQFKDIDGNKVTVRGKGDKKRLVFLNAKAQVAVENYAKERADSNPHLFCGSMGGVAGRKLAGNRGQWYQKRENVHTHNSVDGSSLNQMLKRIGKRVGVIDVHCHKFRRTCATFSLRRGMPLEQISTMLGHESIATTQIYLDLSERELELAHAKYVT